MGQMKCSGGGCVGSARRLRRSRSTATLVLRSGRSLPLISRHLSARSAISCASSMAQVHPAFSSRMSLSLPSSTARSTTSASPMGALAPHITNLAHQVAVQEDVLRLEVPVNDWVWLSAVEEHKGRGNLPGDAQPVTPRQRRRTAFAPQPLLQAAILHVLVHQAPPLHTRSQEHHQMRVMYLPQNLKLQN
uniref:Uncharacterized protein n=1 Tax=Oryza nivara TaxID=4536 RepID=A0A0E0GFH9_ORYNI